MLAINSHLGAVAVAAFGVLYLTGCESLRPTKYSISGAVAKPGEYATYRSITVGEAIKRAGALSADADAEGISWTDGYVGVVGVDLESFQSRKMKSGMKVVVPTKSEKFERSRLMLPKSRTSR